LILVRKPTVKCKCDDKCMLANTESAQAYRRFLSICIQERLFYFCSVISTDVDLVLQKSICKCIMAVRREREEGKGRKRERD